MVPRRIKARLSAHRRTARPLVKPSTTYQRCLQENMKGEYEDSGSEGGDVIIVRQRFQLHAAVGLVSKKVEPGTLAVSR